MEIKSIAIRLLRTDGFEDLALEDVRHSKVLPYLSVVQSTRGSYDIAFGSEESRSTGTGGFFIAPAHVSQTITHHDDRASGSMSARWLFVDAVINKVYRLDEIYHFPTVIDGEMSRELNGLFDDLFATGDVWERYAICYRILGWLTSVAIPTDRRRATGIEKAVAYMGEHFSAPLTVSELARVACTSESNLYATFKKQMGCSPIAYLNQYRLSLAAEKLTETTEAVGSICVSVGIRDALYFSKLFKRTYGISPTQYRARYSRGRSSED